MFKGLFGELRGAAQRGVASDNALLQMGYFIIALRSFELDAGPMAGFERSTVNAAFFPDGQFVSQYVINIGYGDDTTVYPRLPRFNVEEIARFAYLTTGACEHDAPGSVTPTDLNLAEKKG